MPVGRGPAEKVSVDYQPFQGRLEISETQEERVHTVFAVKIQLGNADHRLKPGMPADATFQ